MKHTTACGFVAIIGAPNAGKSTLVNALVGTKVAIVSPKPQTTRTRVLGILVRADTQLVFVDTPGIFKPRRKLDQAMVHAAWQGSRDADIVVLVVDAARGKIDGRSQLIIDEVAKQKMKVFVALNKIDVAEKQSLLKIAAQLDEVGIAERIFMISAVTGDGIADLLDALMPLIPAGPFHYPADQISDMPERLLAAEIIREHLFRQMRDELPYELAVFPENWEDFRNGDVKISAKVVIAREGMKPIVLGEGGKKIKAVREAAQQELSDILERKVHLFLHVTVDEKWQDKREFYTMWHLDDAGNRSN